MTLLAMLDRSVLEVGAKFTSWLACSRRYFFLALFFRAALHYSNAWNRIQADRLVMNGSEEIRNYRCTKITSDIDDFLLKKVEEFLFARLTAEELVGKRLPTSLWRRRVIVWNRVLLSLSAE